MADFTTSFRAVMSVEGGYANHLADRGGETYRGISRRWHPSWPGWARIDAAKAPGFPNNLDHDAVLQEHVAAFYRAYIWDPIGGEECPSQALADELFDIAVHLDPFRAVRFLQRALTAADRTVVQPAVIDDGRFGPQTAAALAACLAADARNEAALLTLLNIQQGAHYLDQFLRFPAQRIHLHGWLARVRPGKFGMAT
jgi:lysozyme family protein